VTRLVLAIAVVAATATGAAAQSFGGWKASGAFELDARWTEAEARDDVLTAGLRLRAFASKTVVGYMGGLDLHLGAGTGGGFAYDGNLYLVGAGLELGWVTVGAVVGGGMSGVTGREPFALQAPVELLAALVPHRRVRLHGWARASFVALADGRQNGSERAPFGDELEAGVALRLGRGGRDHMQRWGNGYFVAALYGERQGVTWTGVAIGYGLHSALGFR
jgi:hypothetical protein